MEVALVAETALMCIICFIIGAKVGQAAAEGRKIEIANPIKARREREAQRETNAEQERIDTIMRNIENYDGTSRGQKDVPWR